MWETWRYGSLRSLLKNSFNESKIKKKPNRQSGAMASVSRLGHSSDAHSHYEVFNWARASHRCRILMPAKHVTSMTIESKVGSITWFPPNLETS